VADSIFTSQVPAITNGNDATAYTLGTEFSRSTSGTITHGRWYFPNPVPTGTTDFVLYSGAGGSAIARASFVSPVAGAWNTVALTTPLAYTAGSVLVACVRTSGNYVATANFFTTDLVNGDITAPAAVNGRLDVADQFPGNVSGNSACFFPDVVFAASGTTVVTKTVATSWDTTAVATKTVASSWNTAAVVTKPVATTWNVAGVVTKSVTTSWDVAALGQVTKTVTTSWHVAAVVAKPVTTSWNVAASTSKTITTSWNTATRVTATVSASWDVAGSTGPPPTGAAPRYVTNSSAVRYTTTTSSRYTTTSRGRQ
jgi:hypothetical protein